MADTEQNPSWRRHKRPQSMAAQQFSAALDNLFRMDDGIDSIVQTVEEKRRSVFQQSQELEELQARLRAAEARLKASGSTEVSPSSSKTTSPEKGNATKAIFSTMEAVRIPEEPEPETMTRTPTSSTSNEYVVVERPKPGRPGRPVPRARLQKPEILKESSEEEDEDEETSEEEEGEEDSSEESKSGSEESDES